jgi:hypothetical protein
VLGPDLDDRVLVEHQVVGLEEGHVAATDLGVDPLLPLLGVRTRSVPSRSVTVMTTLPAMGYSARPGLVLRR